MFTDCASYQPTAGYPSQRLAGLLTGLAMRCVPACRCIDSIFDDRRLPLSGFVPAMNPEKVERSTTVKLTDLPNIGKAGAADLRLLGILRPADLLGHDPTKSLCKCTVQVHDPCVIDVFISITRVINGEDAKPWWAYTAERKRYLSQQSGCRS